MVEPLLVDVCCDGYELREFREPFDEESMDEYLEKTDPDPKDWLTGLNEKRSVSEASLVDEGTGPPNFGLAKEGSPPTRGFLCELLNGGELFDPEFRLLLRDEGISVGGGIWFFQKKERL